MSRRRQKKTQHPPRRVEPTSTPQSKPVASVPAWHWFLVCASLPLVFLAAKLNLDLWHDEIYTVTEFVSRGPWQIVTDYSAPNNHVLYSLVLWPFYLVGDSSFVLRLPSLACAAGTLWLVFRLAYRLAGLPAAMAATATLGLNQMFLVHAIQIRGYSLSMLLAACLADLALAEPKGRTRLRFVTVALVGAAFLYVLPTNLLFFLPLAAAAIVWIGRGASSQLDKVPVVRQVGNLPHEDGTTEKDSHGEVSNAKSKIQNPKSKILTEASAWSAAIVLAAVSYAPIFRQVLEHAGPKGPFSWHALWSPASAFFSAAGRDVLPLLPLWLAGVFCCARRLGHPPRAIEIALPLMCLVVVAGAFVLTGFLGTSPFTRNYTPLLPIMAIGAGWSLAELLEAVRRRWMEWLPVAVSGVAGMLIVLAVLAPTVVTYPGRLGEACSQGRPQDGYFNYYATNYRPSDVVEALSEWILHDESYLIVYAQDDHWNLAYYLSRSAVEHYSAPLRGSAGVVVYVVAPQAADWAELSVQLGVREDELRGWPMLRDFGYYRVYRSPKPHRLPTRPESEQ